MGLDLEDLGSSLGFTIISPRTLGHCLTSLTPTFLSGQLGNSPYRLVGSLNEVLDIKWGLLLVFDS